ncbi:TadE/TadG family type IV pilus assembly protein [Geomesophilobacter sediminis]|uniref:Pilus assembly protein n=1 Tax=Geomesophilobacter sediminis TaxID=2798584 RepID=A0A8J7IPW1_9BACT|nr:TadE family protein [Geomesophilobacter sediminis]MBJ6725733.1 pilus assembly protein [Geomesophilobacter sediminis]
MTARGEKGSALVEMAISITLLLLILFGTIEFGRVMYMRNTLNLAAREGARLASVTPAPIDEAKIQARVTQLAPFANVQATTSTSTGGITTACPPGTDCTVTVQVTCPFNTVVPQLIPQLNNINLTTQATMRWEN